VLHRLRAARYASELGAFIRGAAVPGRMNLLAPDRSVFRFDMDALDRFAPRLNIMRISSARQLPSLRLGEHEGLQQRDVAPPGSRPKDPFRRSQTALERVLRGCVTDGLLHGFLSANVDYHQDEPLRRAGLRLGIPFFVLLKETPISREHTDWQQGLIGGRAVPDRGDHVLVGGPLGALYVELGSVAPERLHVTGFPRFDRYRDLDVSLPLDHVTFFPPNRLHGHSTEVFDVLLDAVLALGRRTGATLVLKCKDNRSARDVRDALAGRAGVQDEVTVTTQNPAEPLQRSALVVGSSSTALAEAMLTRARVLNLVSRNDLLGIAPRPDLGYLTYDSHLALTDALADVQRLDGLGIQPERVAERRQLVAEVLTLPEGRTASGIVEEHVLREVALATEERSG
jgi:hypothetical protein